MDKRQPDLFSAGSVRAEIAPPAVIGSAVAPADLDDEALMAAIPISGISDAPALAAEAARRKLQAAIPALERLCRRFTGFGADRLIPEQVAALQAIGLIGGAEAGRAVARIIVKGAVQGPALAIAIATAADLNADLPPAIVDAALRHADPKIRADACRCARRSAETIAVLVDLLDDLNGTVRNAAAYALGRMGRSEARPLLTRLLREGPSIALIDAITLVADEEIITILGRIARDLPELADAALDALEAIDHPRAERIVARIVGNTGGYDG
jgi:HEAT repeat protein